MYSYKRSALIVAAVSVIVGLILLIFPTITAKVIAYITASFLMIFAIAEIIMYFMSDPASQHNGFMIGVLSFIISIFIFASAKKFIELIPILLGFFIIFSGVATLQQTIDLIRRRIKGWLAMLIVSAVNIILGILCISNPFAAVTTLMSIIGVGFIFSGVSDIVAVLYFSEK